MARTGPPAYAWDWFARQRLLWRESRARLARSDAPSGPRYRAVDSRAEVVALLRSDYARDETVRGVVDAVVRDLVFLGRTAGTFADLGLHNAPRGLRWWWSGLTGEDLEATATTSTRPRHAQLSLDELADDDVRLAMEEVHGGYGDERGA